MEMNLSKEGWGCYTVILRNIKTKSSEARTTDSQDRFSKKRKIKAELNLF